ncbi:MAG: chalcone isomerase family protein [Janthinobacterium lividum]
MKLFSRLTLLVTSMLAVLLLSPVALAGWQTSLANAHLLGAGDFRKFGFLVYTARLYTPADHLDDSTPFALELTYHRSIKGDALVDASINEIKRIQGSAVSAEQLQRWREQMQQSFVDVEEGSRLTGVFLPGQGAQFYVGDQLKSEIKDLTYAKAFFAIWLDPRSRDPDLRAQLLGTSKN